jgi:hypothetical protein
MLPVGQEPPPPLTPPLSSVFWNSPIRNRLLQRRHLFATPAQHLPRSAKFPSSRKEPRQHIPTPPSTPTLSLPHLRSRDDDDLRCPCPPVSPVINPARPMRTSFAALVSVLGLASASSTAGSTDAALEVLSNVLGPLATSFALELLPDNSTTASFTYNAKGGQVNVRGNTNGALVAGAHDWLKNHQDVSLSWTATGGDSGVCVVFVWSERVREKTQLQQHSHHLSALPPPPSLTPPPHTQFREASRCRTSRKSPRHPPTSTFMTSTSAPTAIPGCGGGTGTGGATSSTGWP